MTTQLAPLAVQRFVDNNGNALAGGLLYTYQAGTSTPQATYTDSTGSTPNTNPVVLNSRGDANVWVTGAQAYKFILKDSLGNLIWSVDQVTDGSVNSALAADLANTIDMTKGAGMVGYLSPGVGAVGSTVSKRLGESYDAVHDFGCDNTGATNTTAALLSFYNACILSGTRGRIRGGTYLVTPGILKFYNGGATKFWPEIETDGYEATIFKVDPATNINLPIITITNVLVNGAQTFGGSYYWLGGSHGGLSFIDTTGVGAPLRSAWSLTGIWFCKFGEQQGTTLRGDLITCPANYSAGANPDPYSTANCHFQALMGNALQGSVVNNQDGVGWDSNVVEQVTNYYSYATTWFGIGQGCVIKQFSTAGCLGWCFDDGTFVGSVLGTGGNRLLIDVAEFDSCQYILRINHLSDFEIKRLRVNHRFGAAAGALNTSGLYWPLAVLDITGGVNPSIISGYIHVQNRVSGGGAIGQLGKFLDFHNSSNVFDLHISADWQDESAIGVTNGWLTAATNFSTAMTLLLEREGEALIDTRYKDISDGLGSAAITLIPNSGFGTVASKIAFSGAQVSLSISTAYNLATSTYTAPRSGMYLVHATFPLTCAVGTKVRMAFLTTMQGVECRIDQYQVNAGNQSYSNSGQIFLNAGDSVYVTADQNTATASMASTPQSNVNECRFVVIPL